MPVFDASPFKRLLPVGECAHMNGLAVVKGEDIGQTDLVPFSAVFEPDSRMNKHDDFIAGDNEPFRFAASFGPVRARLR
jgi:hypothetical protein